MRVSSKARSDLRAIKSRLRKATSSTKRIRKIAKSVVRGAAETKFRSSHHDESNLATLSQGIREHTPCRIGGGTLTNQRIGNDCNMFGIDVRGYVFNNSNADIVHVRAMAIIDKERVGGTTDLGELLLKNNAPAPHNQGAMSAVYAVNKQRYRVLWDTVFTLSPLTAGNGSSSTRRFQKWIKAPLKLKFNDDSATSITQNDVKVVFWACEADGDTLLGDNVELYSQVIGYYKDF